MGQLLAHGASRLALVLITAGLAGAQTIEFDAPRALDPAPSRGVQNSDADAISRAESLFRLGDAALSEGREEAARRAFDQALDVFLELKGASAADSGLLSTYHSLVDRIHLAEVAAGSRRRWAPARFSESPPTTVAITIVPVEAESESTLAELGDRIETITPTAMARQNNEAVLGAEVIDLPIEMNDQVLGAIDLYSGRFKAWFSRALSRGIPHLPRIREILAEAGIPQDLAYVPIVESAFNPTALSRAKAKGLWQFIPSTGKQYGLKQDFFVDERSNMEKATVAAAQYLKNLYAMFGDWNLALAGYNAGEGTVLRAIKRAQTNDFWALAKTKSFRSETKNYVPLIHAAIVIAKSPGSYGIDVATEEIRVAETIQVKGSYPIATVARCANTEPGDIRQLNPELRRGMTPASAFDLKVPGGVGEQVTACLAAERTMNYTRHVVRKRDTFSLIAKMFGVSASEIARVNGLTAKSRLKPGTELAIPRNPKASLTKTASASSVRPPGAPYRIRKGDTLSSVAARHSTTVEAIKSLNGLSSSRLSIGQMLRVAAAGNDSSPE